MNNEQVFDDLICCDCNFNQLKSLKKIKRICNGCGSDLVKQRMEEIEFLQTQINFIESKEKPDTKSFEFNGVIQDISRNKKGSKYYKDPHTAFKILTREINEKEMDELVYGGSHGNAVCLKIRVVKEKKK